MQKIKEFRSKIETWLQSNKAATAIMWVLVLLYPIYLTLPSNYLSFLSSETPKELMQTQ